MARPKHIGFDSRPRHSEKRLERRQEQRAKQDGTTATQAMIKKESVRHTKVRNAVAIASAHLVHGVLFPLNHMLLASDLLPSVERKLGRTLLEILRIKRRKDPSRRFSYWANVKKSAKRLYILDARRADEYKESHIPTARNFHFGLFEPLPKDLEEMDRETPIVTYCAVGLRSGAFARRLRKMGFKHTYVLKGGYYRWANLGYPIVSSGGYQVRTVKSQHFIASILLKADLQMMEIHNPQLTRKRHFLRRAANRMRRRQYARESRVVHVDYSPLRKHFVHSADSNQMPGTPEQSDNPLSFQKDEKNVTQFVSEDGDQSANSAPVESERSALFHSSYGFRPQVLPGAPNYQPAKVRSQLTEDDEEDDDSKWETMSEADSVLGNSSSSNSSGFNSHHVSIDSSSPQVVAVEPSHIHGHSASSKHSTGKATPPPAETTPYVAPIDGTTATVPNKSSGKKHHHHHRSLAEVLGFKKHHHSSSTSSSTQPTISTLPSGGLVAPAPLCSTHVASSSVQQPITTMPSLGPVVNTVQYVVPAGNNTSTMPVSQAHEKPLISTNPQSGVTPIQSF